MSTWGHFTVLSFFLFSVSFSAQAAPNCSNLIQELQSMQQAQAEVKKSLVANHEIFASTLEEYSAQVRGESKRGATNPATAAKNMKASANSFRTRGLQSQDLVRKLDQASEELINKVVACLKTKA